MTSYESCHVKRKKQTIIFCPKQETSLFQPRIACGKSVWTLHTIWGNNNHLNSFILTKDGKNAHNSTAIRVKFKAANTYLFAAHLAPMCAPFNQICGANIYSVKLNFIDRCSIDGINSFHRDETPLIHSVMSFGFFAFPFASNAISFHGTFEIWNFSISRCVISCSYIK